MLFADSALCLSYYLGDVGRGGGVGRGGSVGSRGGLVGGGRGVGGLGVLLGVLGNTLVGDIGDETALLTGGGGVAGGLDPAVGESDHVLALHVAVAVLGLALLEVSLDRGEITNN